MVRHEYMLSDVLICVSPTSGQSTLAILASAASTLPRTTLCVARRACCQPTRCCARTQTHADVSVTG